VSFEDPMLDEAMKSIFAVADMQQEGKFRPRRERDILSVSLGNPKHPGRVRGISSKEGWIRPSMEDLIQRRMDSALNGKMSIRNVIDTRNKWQINFRKRLRKTSKI